MGSVDERREANYDIDHPIRLSASPRFYYASYQSIETPMASRRTYRLILLENRLEVMVISDPDIARGSASMNVKVGDMSDPPGMQGLAHLCEHALFLGTKKYPGENDLTGFLSKFAGSANAFTGKEDTNYQLQVDCEAMEESLDRFAQIFLSPLFYSDRIRRAVSAIDREYKDNLLQDDWRLVQLGRSLSDPTHPYSKFGVGNAETLSTATASDADILRKELVSFFDQFYSADNMTLVVCARQSIDILVDLIVNKFSEISRHDFPVQPTFPPHPFGPESLQTKVFCRSISDVRLLEITFPISDQNLDHLTKPAEIVSHFVGHEGEESLLSSLKEKGWATDITAGVIGGASGFDFFKIFLGLTPSGFLHHQDVLGMIFNFTAFLGDTLIPQWAFEELRSLGTLHFQIQEEYTPSVLSQRMHLPIPRKCILSLEYCLAEVNPTAVKHLAKLLKPSNCRVILLSQLLPDGSAKFQSSERFSNVEYTIVPLSPLRIGEFDEPLPRWRLPPPNKFAPPADASLIMKSRKHTIVSHEPYLLQKAAHSHLWFEASTSSTNISLFIFLRAPQVTSTAFAEVQSHVLVRMFTAVIAQCRYEAKLAGLECCINLQDGGIEMILEGPLYDQLLALAKYVSRCFAELNISRRLDYFSAARDEVRSLLRKEGVEPFQAVEHHTTFLLRDDLWSDKEKLCEIEKLLAEGSQEFLEHLLLHHRLEVLAYGALSPSEATEIFKMLEYTLSTRTTVTFKNCRTRSLALKATHEYVFEMDVWENGGTSCLGWHCQIGHSSDLHLQAMLSLFSQIAGEAIFHEMRTIQELGYLVTSGVREEMDALGFGVLIQSSHDTYFLKEKIEDFFRVGLLSLLEEMSDNRFEEYRRTLVQSRSDRVQNSVDQSVAHWREILRDRFDFLRYERETTIQKALEKTDLINFYKCYLWPESDLRSSLLCVHLRGHAEAMPQSTRCPDESVDNSDLIEELAEETSYWQDSTKNLSCRTSLENDCFHEVDTVAPHKEGLRRQSMIMNIRKFKAHLPSLAPLKKTVREKV